MTVHFLHAPTGVRHSFVPKKVINYPLAQEASFLAAREVPVEIYNGQQGQPLDIESIAAQVAPVDWIVAPLMEGTACAETLDFALRLKRRTGARVVATSYLASFATEEILAAFPAADHLIKGEDEATLSHLVSSKTRTNFGQVVQGEPVDPSLWVFPEQARWGPYGVLQTSRGCAHSCTFCSANTLGDPAGRPHWRALPIDVVQNWLQRMRQAGASFVEFVDADFLGTNAEGLRRGAALAAAGHLGLSMMAATRADTIVRHAHLIEGLRDAGIVKWQVGVESADLATLKRYRKGLVPSTSLKAVDLLVELGVSMRLEFIMFEPWSTLDSLKANLEMLAALSERGVLIQRALFNRLRVGRWSPQLFRTLLNQGKLVRHIFPLYDYEDYDPQVMLVCAAVRAGHDRKTGLAVTLSLLIERLLDIGIFQDCRAEVSARLRALDGILWRFVDRVVNSDAKLNGEGNDPAAEELHAEVTAWLPDAWDILRHPACEATFPGVTEWARRSLLAADPSLADVIDVVSAGAPER